jgi:selenocysteine-specific elongation factor
MMSNRMDVALEFAAELKTLPQEVILAAGATRVQARLVYYPPSKGSPSGPVLARAELSVPADVRWKDGFELAAQRGGGSIGRGRILHPQAPKLGQVRMARRSGLLEKLLGGEGDMVQAFALERGVQGIREDELSELAGLKPGRLERLSPELEAQGKVKILSFSPLVLVARDSLDLLGRKILGVLAKNHEKHPDLGGIGTPSLRKRFRIPDKVLVLTLKALQKSGDVVEEQGLYRLAAFRPPVSTQEETILAELEAMCLKGEFYSVSLDEIRARFRLTPAKLQKLLDILVERKRIVQGQDGFYLHSRWLEDIVDKLKRSKKRELSVGDFKRMTGLTRKYAIPLLELLDGMGVTRRKGPVREIL